MSNLVPRVARVRFNHKNAYRQNWTTRSRVTIINHNPHYNTYHSPALRYVSPCLSYYDQHQDSYGKKITRKITSTNLVFVVVWLWARSGPGCSRYPPDALSSGVNKTNMYVIDLAPVVQRMDNAIHLKNHYPTDSVVGFVNTYPFDSVIQPFNNWAIQD